MIVHLVPNYQIRPIFGASLFVLAMDAMEWDLLAISDYRAMSLITGLADLSRFFVFVILDQRRSCMSGYFLNVSGNGLSFLLLQTRLRATRFFSVSLPFQHVTRKYGEAPSMPM